MKHLSDKFEKQISHFILSKYNLKADLSELCYDLNKIALSHNSLPEIKKSGVPKRLLTKWFRTTNIKGDMREHSAYGFAEYIDKHYLIIPIKRESWYSNIVFNILKLIKI